MTRVLNFPAASTPATTAPASAWPREPQTVDDTGLPFVFLVELLAKRMFVRGTPRLTDLAAELCLAGAVVGTVAQHLRREGLLEVSRRGATDADVAFELSAAGRLRAAEWLDRNRYTGPTPVTLAAYTQRVALQSRARRRVTRAMLDAAFADLVVPAAWRERVGAALNSGRPMLLHGAAGAGKTWLASQLHRLLPGTVLLPHAILVDGDVVRVFDPQWHVTADEPPRGRAALDNRARRDARWVPCARPSVMVGGELTPAMLDLGFDGGAGCYEAPLHFKANNGVFIVDDLGRQVISPRALMNRWIVPMDRGFDLLMLRSGAKFTIPFDLVLVFSSNLRPEQLDDEAFLRRIGHKIPLGPLSAGEYREVFRRACDAAAVAFDATALDTLLDDLHRRCGRPLLASVPRDLLALVGSRCAYLDQPAVASTDHLRWAWQTFYHDDGAEAGASMPDAIGAASAGSACVPENLSNGRAR